MKTYSAKPTDVKRMWYLFDASELPLGKMSTKIAKMLIGKDKVQFTKHIDCGDYVVVINSDKLVMTGDKYTDKIYYKHSNYPGGLKETSLQDMIIKDSRNVIFQAVRGMLPVNKLRADRLNRLKIFKDDNHLHQAQQPTIISLKDLK